MVTDLVANGLNQIKLGSRVKKKEVSFWSSKLLEEILRVMEEEGYIRGFITKVENNKRRSTIYLKYKDGVSSITGLRKITTPSRKVSAGWRELPIVMSGLATVIVSTSQGVLCEKEARKRKLGGIILAYVW
ncbi:uS8 family ribosomal protein [Candidatus Mycoplasma haematominutum]|uniref:Small ribosomal subunit protein uS8 n=1 Tax=Candidatus Mycoplasma haematominutum 'Birmingham 1' TaxID=1116213 RepID=G8C329_9MOLU|nr:30S ribosomal protein S8 [Candidatus Mycoplasma haematominutum]CCE66727.1 ribosomal protein S8 [Candidatus Mycoplasma haematominutum 'Birmingham 1']